MELYDPAQCAVFRKTKDRHGGLSNMAPGFPLRVNGIDISTSEALYQACRFPDLPHVQKLIFAEKSPMAAKMRSKPYRDRTRPDWDRVRVPIMRWCLLVKLSQNWLSFSQVLLSTGDLPIVEESHRDAFWGAIPTDDGRLAGQNRLGKLLMALRENVASGILDADSPVRPPSVANLLIDGKPVGELRPRPGFGPGMLFD